MTDPSWWSGNLSCALRGGILLVVGIAQLHQHIIRVTTITKTSARTEIDHMIQLHVIATAWNPLTTTLSDKIEAVQRRAQSCHTVYNIPRTSWIPTVNRIKKLDWKTLSERRDHRWICMYRTMH